MQISTTKILSSVGIIAGLTIGAFAISAFATSWTPATCDAPECNTSAPLNVGPDSQAKAGGLSIMSVGGQTNPTGNALDVNGKASFLSSVGVVMDLIIGGTTRTLGGLVIQTCNPGSCPGDSGLPVETGQIWLVNQ